MRENDFHIFVPGDFRSQNCFPGYICSALCICKIRCL